LKICSVPLRRLVFKVKEFSRKIGLLTKLKLGLVFAQVVAALERTYGIDLPDSWTHWTKIFRVLGEVDWLNWVVPSSCIVGSGMKEALLLRSLVPLIVIVGIPLTFAFVSVARRSMGIERARTPGAAVCAGLLQGLPASLVLAFCFTPSLSADIFRAWYCVGFDYDGTEEHSFLYDEPSIRCNGHAEHNEVLAVAWVLVLLWPIGIVLLYGGLLASVRRVIIEDLDKTPLFYATSFLHRDFKRGMFWWEIIALIQRTVLTGWLLLIDTDHHFIRLVIAILVVITFLIMLLVSSPYKKRLDHAMAVAVQVLFICIFIGGMVVGLFDDITKDHEGTSQLAFRVLGVRSADDVVVIMIVVAFMMLAVLAVCLLLEMYMHVVTVRLEAKFSTCTMDPPKVAWKPLDIYACFLSHYKNEAACDARYLHDVLRKMLCAPCFLDSSSLKDLRYLISEGLYRSDVMLILLTKRVLTRPWCLLEVYFATTRGIPIFPVEVAGGGFDMTEVIAYVMDLPGSMHRENPAGLDTLERELGDIPISKLRAEVLSVLRKFDPETYKLKQWISSASDEGMVASLKDIVESMAELTGRRLSRKVSSAPSWKAASTQPPVKLTSSVKLRTAGIAATITYEPAYLAQARVLKAELSRKLNRNVPLGEEDVVQSLVALRVSAHVVLLSERLLTTPSCVVEMYVAIRARVPVITILLDQAGYNFQDAGMRLSSVAEWTRGLADEAFALPLRAQLAALSSISQPVPLEEVQQALLETITAVIAIPWQPQGGRNHYAAVMAEVACMIPSTLPLRKRKSSRSIDADMTTNTWLKSTTSSVSTKCGTSPAKMSSLGEASAPPILMSTNEHQG